MQGCGATAIRFTPSLIVTEEEAHTALDIFESAMKAVLR